MPAETLLAVSLTRAAPPLAEQVDAAVRAGARLIELRVDRIQDDSAVEALLGQPHALPFIVTVRSAEEGGAWEGDEAQRVALLERLARLGPGFVDVEYAAWQRSQDVRERIGSLCDLEGSHGESSGDAASRSPRNTLVLSCHDSHGTPDKLDDVFDRLEASPAGIVKAVFTAGDALDSCRVLAQLQRRGRRKPMIALAMGEAGLLTRVLARKFGAFLTFAAPRRGAESAPGQPTIDELRDIYRGDSIKPSTSVFGVIGWPVSHSLSPRLHNAAMAAKGIDGVYLPLPVRPAYENLAAFLDYVIDNAWLDFAGMSVTIPHKEHVARWLEGRGLPVGELVRRCGAVNTLVWDQSPERKRRVQDQSPERKRRVPTSEGGWRGENTDAPGALLALETVPELAGGGLDRSTVDVLGAGGVARAVVAALVSRDCRVTIYNRDEGRARNLAQRLGCDWRPWEQRSSGTGRILINCTSVGMMPEVGLSPISPDRFRPDTVVFDTIYNPEQTRLLREAEACGCRVVSGLELFTAQAAEQSALWHGRRG